MKKLVNPLPTGGAPLFGTETVVDVLQTEVWDVLEALMSTINFEAIGTTFSPSGNAFILTGGLVTYAPGADTYNITAGIVYFPAAKAFARFPQVIGLTPTQGIFDYADLELLDPVIEQKTFADAALKDYFTIRNARIVAQSTATHRLRFVLLGAVTTKITPNYDTVYKKPINEVASNLGQMTMTRLDIGTWNMNVTPSVAIAVGDAVGKANIAGVQVIIRSDIKAGNTRNQYPIDYFDSTAAADQLNGWWTIVENTADNGFAISLNRTTNGFFDTVDFEDALESRGWVIITYYNIAAWSTN